MKAKLIGKVKKIAAVATGALFVGATLGMASVFASGLSNLGPTSSNQFLSNGHVNAVFVVGANSAPSDIAGAIDISAALTAAAAASHSSSVTGQISIGTLALRSKTSTNALLAGTFSAFKPSSIMLAAENFTSKGVNYTSVENLSFNSSVIPKFDGLNVVLPKGAYSLNSYIQYRNGTAINLNDTVGLANASFFFGNSKATLLSINKDNASFGASKTYTTVLMPTTLTVAGNTIDLMGAVEDIANASQSQVEVSVNGGATQYINLNVPTTVKQVTLTPEGLFKYTNGTAFLKSLQVSSISVVQRLNSSAVSSKLSSGLSMLNATNTSSEFVLTSTTNSTLPYNFKTTSVLNFPQNLTTLDLEPLTHNYANGMNLTITTGKAVNDSIIPVAFENGSGSNMSKIIAFNYTHNLPGVSFGTNFRSSTNVAPLNYFGSPNYYLAHFQSYNNGTLTNPSLINGSSEYVYPAPTHAAYYYTNLKDLPSTVKTNLTGNATLFYNATSGPIDNVVNAPTKNTVNFVYELPNGKDFLLTFKPVVFSATISSKPNATLTYSGVTYNVSGFAIYNSTSIPLATTKINSSKIYSLDGYNLTLKNVNVTLTSVTNGTDKHTKKVLIAEPVLTGPSLTFAPNNNGTKYSLLPGQNVVYNAAGASMNELNLSGNLGSIMFSNNDLQYIDPTGASVSVPISENPSSFTTYFTDVKNTSANTWGTKINYGKVKMYDNASSTGNATVMIPTQNYTLAVAGSQVVSSVTNYTIGQTVGAGELLGINGVSSVSASNLLKNNVDLVKFDTAFMPTASTTNAVPVIVIGGPAINTAAAELLFNSTTPEYGSAFTNATNVSSGEALVQLFSNVKAFNNEPALLIAGYSGNDTLEASQVVASFLIGEPITNVNMTGNKVILSASSAGYTGVKSLN